MPELSERTIPKPKASFLNIGCGYRFSHDVRWLNVDLAPTSQEVQKIDVAEGLPFQDQSFLGVYHSHVLEHLDSEAGLRLVRECFRVLQPGGVLRVAVPDLERIAVGYLDRLGEARKGLPGSGRRHNWAVLELCDQMTRRKSGGGMIHFLDDSEPLGRAYAVERCGAEVRQIIESLDRSREPVVPLRRLRPNLRAVIRKLRNRFVHFVVGKDSRALMEGRFCVSGELHRHMYDSFSLSSVLAGAGFTAMRAKRATESLIADWSSFELDADASGVTHKPDSLFMEAIKPSAPGVAS